MAAAGFTAVKFDPAGAYTIRGGHQPSMPDLDRSEAFCQAIRAAVGDRADILFGTHGQFTPSGAIRLARRIAPYDPLWFEEPVPPDLPLDLAAVAAQSPVPIAAGERLTTKAEFATLLRAGGVGILQPSLGRVGGLLEARKIAATGRGLRRPGRAAPLRRADRLGGGHPARPLDPELPDPGDDWDRRRLPRRAPEGRHPLGGRLRPAPRRPGARGRDRRGGRARPSLGRHPAAPRDEPGPARPARGARLRRRLRSSGGGHSAARLMKPPDWRSQKRE